MIIYEDNHLLIVEKPVNVLSQGDRTGDPDLVTILKADLKVRYQKPGNVYLGLVHRLDRPVGGVMVFAKTSKAAGRLSEQIRTGKFKKKYLAIVHGKLGQLQGSYVHYLKKQGSTNTVTGKRKQFPGSKKAILDYELLETKDYLSLVKINLITGRSHQIRVQFATEGHPLVGDQKYGKSDQKRIQIALWSYQLGLFHPTRKDWLVFNLSPPQNQFPWNLFDLEDVL